MTALSVSSRFSHLTDGLIAAWMPFATAAVLALGSMAASAAPANPQASGYRELSVEVIGNGRPLIMIPGLNSAADTWRETCAALQPEVQCHLLQLPGFAGQPPAQPAIEGDAFLDAMRDRILAYVHERALRSPVVIGHSLGGLLALKMALKSPHTFSRLIIVDSLPFFPAAQNPAASVASVTPMAEGMLAADDASFFRNAQAALAGMSRSSERVATLGEWGRSSDRATTTQAMYELMTTDLRAELVNIHSPTLVLGAWAAYAPYGATRESTESIFRGQYAALDGVRIAMSESGYHFLMWDDPQWLQSQVRAFLNTDTVAGE